MSEWEGQAFGLPLLFSIQTEIFLRRLKVKETACVLGFLPLNVVLGNPKWLVQDFHKQEARGDHPDSFH